jgi:hypothetical protein
MVMSEDRKYYPDDDRAAANTHQDGEEVTLADTVLIAAVSERDGSKKWRTATGAAP